MTDADQEPEAGPGVDGSPLHSAAASSVFNWRGAGNAAAAAPEPPAASQQPNPEEEETMATKFGGPQVAVCKLLAEGDLDRDAIAAKLPALTSAQVSSALNNSKTQGRIVWIDKDQVYRLTAAGKEWVAGMADGKTTSAKGHRRGGGAARKKATKARRAKRATVAKEVDTSPRDDAEEATFRCGVMSDGAFFLSKGEVAIELDKEEHAEMLRYLERMAEEA
jgi:hypothetical protein